MTYETEMKEYLQAKELPADEGTYPEELMTQITIKAFDELTDLIQELEEECNEADGELYRCEAALESLNDKLTDIKEVLLQE